MSKDITKGGTSTQGRQGQDDHRSNQDKQQRTGTSTSTNRPTTPGTTSRDQESAREIWPGQPRVDLPGTQAGRSQNEQQRRERERNKPE